MPMCDWSSDVCSFPDLEISPGCSLEGLMLKLKLRYFDHLIRRTDSLDPTLWDPMDCSTPGFPVHHQLPELAQTHVRHPGMTGHLSICVWNLRVFPYYAWGCQYPFVLCIPPPSAGDLRELPRVPLRGEGPGHLFESKPVDECTTRRGTDIPMHNTEKHADSKHRSTRYKVCLHGFISWYPFMLYNAQM